MARVEITRFEWDADNRDVASVHFELGRSRFRFWNVRRHEGSHGVRQYVTSPARKVGGNHCPTVEFPPSLLTDVEGALLGAFLAAWRARDAGVGAGPTARTTPHAEPGIPF